MGEEYLPYDKTWAEVAEIRDRENTDLRRQLEEANTAATMYKAMVCSQSCKMCFPPPDGEPLPWDDLQAEVERLRVAARMQTESVGRLLARIGDLERGINRAIETAEEEDDDAGSRQCRYVVGILRTALAPVEKENG